MLFVARPHLYDSVPGIPLAYWGGAELGSRSEERIFQLADEAVGKLVGLNIEPTPEEDWTDSQIREYVQECQRIIRTARRRQPGLRFNLFDIPPSGLWDLTVYMRAQGKDPIPFNPEWYEKRFEEIEEKAKKWISLMSRLSRRRDSNGRWARDGLIDDLDTLGLQAYVNKWTNEAWIHYWLDEVSRFDKELIPWVWPRYGTTFPEVASLEELEQLIRILKDHDVRSVILWEGSQFNPHETDEGIQLFVEAFGE